MITENQIHAYPDRLTSLWSEGGKDIAVSFLRRVVSENITLAQLVKALEFEQVRNHLAGLELKEILPEIAAPMRTLAPVPLQPTSAPMRAPAKAPRRKRRSPDGGCA